MKIFLIPICLVISFLLFSFSNHELTNAKKFESQQIAILATYGEYIYNRESCSKCHSLVDDVEMSKVSLDGLGGKYTNSWYFNYFFNPTSMIPNSNKSSFLGLFYKKIDKEKLFDLLIKKYGNEVKKDSSFIFEKLNNEVNEMQNNLKADHIEIENNQQFEIYSLLAYLHKIESSSIKKTKDSLFMIEINKKDEVWYKIIDDDQNEFWKIARSKNLVVQKQGSVLFKRTCFPCHREDGGGSIAPNLTDEYWIYGGSVKEIATSIIFGRPERGMMSWKENFNYSEIAQIVAYIRSLHGTHPKNPKEPQGKFYKEK